MYKTVAVSEIAISKHGWNALWMIYNIPDWQLWRDGEAFKELDTFGLIAAEDAFGRLCKCRVNERGRVYVETHYAGYLD